MVLSHRRAAVNYWASVHRGAGRFASAASARNADLPPARDRSRARVSGVYDKVK